MNDFATTFPKAAAVLEQGRKENLHAGAQIYISQLGTVMANTTVGEGWGPNPFTSDSLLLWLSSGKPLTALVMARLWEQGKVDLDEPVARWLPQFGQMGKETLSVRHLLTHTGGFRAADKLHDALGWDEMISRICATPLEEGWEVGKKAGYQIASSWYVLAALAERVTGQPFSRHLREAILQPWGVEEAWVGMTPEEYGRFSGRIGSIYRMDTTPPQPHPWIDLEQGCVQCRPGGGARGPIRELGRVYEHLLQLWDGLTDPASVLQPATVRMFCSRHRVGLFDHTFQHTLDWGLGWIINSNQYGPETVPYGFGRHASSDAFGHGGAQSSCAFADPVHGLVVAWVCNGMPGERRHQRRGREFNSAIYQDLGLAK